MAFIALPNGIRVAMEYRLDGQLIVNVYHVKAIEPVVSANLTTLATVFFDWWDLTMKSNFTDAISLHRVVAKDVTVEDGAIAEIVDGPGVPGLLTSDAVPNNVAAVISLHTAKTGRSFRGRNYYAGLSEGSFTGSAINTGFLGDLLNDAAQLKADINDSGGLALGVASYYHNGAPRTEGVITEVTVMQADAVADSQRRRLPGRGV